MKRQLSIPTWYLPALFIPVLLLMLSAPAVGVEIDLQQGFTALKDQQFGQAQKTFAAIVKEDPYDYRALHGRGLAHYYQGDFSAAMADYNASLGTNPEFADAYLSRGMLWYYSGEYGRAISDYRRALKLSPHHPKAMNQLAWVLAVCPEKRHRNGKEALEWARKAADLNDTLNYNDTLAAAYAATGDYTNAVNTQKKVISTLVDQNREDDLDPYLERLKAYKHNTPWHDIPRSDEAGIRAQEKPPATTPPESDSAPKPAQSAAAPLPAAAAAATKTTTETPAAAKAPAAETEVAPAPEAGDKPPETTPEKTESQVVLTDLTDVKDTSPPVKRKPTLETYESTFPYTIFVSQYKDRQKANSIAISLRTKGDPAFVAMARSTDAGDWYRIFVGIYRNRRETAAAAAKLIERQFIRAEVVRKPYAIQVGIFDNPEVLQLAEAALESKGHTSYRVPYIDPSVRLMIGAYNTPKAPQVTLDELAAAGYDPVVVKR